jgi:sugar lactone lactonase YvrE
MVTTLAGSGSVGSTNAAGTAASFNFPLGVAVDSSGNLYVADNGNNLIREINPGGVVFTLAGSGSPGSTNATGTAASFNSPNGVAVDSFGNVYVADANNNLIREISSGAMVTTLAGQAPPAPHGAANGIGAAASFWDPTDIAVDTSGNVFVADGGNEMVREIGSGAVVSFLAGSGSTGSANGTGAAASFNTPYGVATDSSGNVYVADQYNNMIRVVTPGGVVTTLAGQLTPGSTNATGTAASFNRPSGVAVDASGNVYVADTLNNLIRKITPGGVVTTLAGSGSYGSANGPANMASFRYPASVAVDSSGNVYVADTYSNLIRKIAP